MAAPRANRQRPDWLMPLATIAALLLLQVPTALAAAPVTANPADAAPAAVTDLLGVRTALDLDMARLSKWNDALERHEASLADPQECHFAHPSVCFKMYWSTLVEELAPLSREEQLRRVNDEINRLQYRSDRALWGRADYWASPAEVFERQAGDCEDLAMFKYQLLRVMGFAADDMRLTLVATQTHAHMVLIVGGGDVPVVLDNLTPDVVAAADYTGYTPIYSLNEAGWQMLAVN